MPNQIKAGADAPRRPELRIVAFEPFDRGSHRAVRESISRHSRHQWRWLTRPGRAWKWRMRLAAVELVEEAADGGFFEPPVDAIFATSLMSAADLRALLPAGLRGTPVILYMHENQAAYPDPESQERDVHFALTNLTSILAADLTVWNSDFNRRSFVDGIESLLRHAPDRLPGSVRERVEQRSTVIWPPVGPPPEATAASGNPGVLHNSIRVVWPHRWEHDKGPGELLAVAPGSTPTGSTCGGRSWGSASGRPHPSWPSSSGASRTASITSDMWPTATSTGGSCRPATGCSRPPGTSSSGSRWSKRCWRAACPGCRIG